MFSYRNLRNVGLWFLLSPQGAAKDSVVPELGLWVPDDPLM